MALQNLTMDQVINSTGLSEGTVKKLLRGRSKPHARTLHRLAVGLGVSADEFFWPCPDLGGPTPGSTNREIRQKVKMLLKSDQRSLVIELVEALSRYSTEAVKSETRLNSNTVIREPRLSPK